MPQRVAADDVVPGADTRYRRIDWDELRYAIGVLRSKGVADHITDVMGNKIDLVDLQRIQNTRDVFTLGLLVIPASRPRRETHAAEIGNDNRVGELQNRG